MKTVAVVSAKGGVGKTTVSVNLAAAFWQAGRDVLVVDLDPQNAVALHLGLDTAARLGVSDALLGEVELQNVVVKSPSGVRMIPFGNEIDEMRRHALEQKLHEEPGVLGRYLQTLGLPEDTIVIIDTPPGPSAYLRQALTLADIAVVVSLADAGSFATLPMMLGLIQTYCGGRASFVAYGLILNQVDRSKQLSKDVATVVEGSFGGRVIGLIHQDQSVAESLAFQESVLAYAPYAQASVEFAQCAERIAATLPRAAAGSTQ